MGMSLSARLVFGYVWTEEGTGPFVEVMEEFGLDENEHDWEDLLFERWLQENPGHGLESPFDRDGNWKSGGVGDGWRRSGTPEEEAQADARYAKKDELVAPHAAIDDGYHGISNFTLPLISVKDSEIKVYGGNAKLIAPHMLEIQDGWLEDLKRWVEATGADLSDAEGPGWFMTALYW